MNDIINNMIERRSIRKYKAEQITEGHTAVAVFEDPFYAEEYDEVNSDYEDRY